MVTKYANTVSTVNDIVSAQSKDRTTQTLLENFEGSFFLKEQSGKKGYLGAFTHPVAIILKYENLRIKRKNCVSA